VRVEQPRAEQTANDLLQSVTEDERIVISSESNPLTISVLSRPKISQGDMLLQKSSEAAQVSVPMTFGLNFPAPKAVPAGAVAIRPVMVDSTQTGSGDFSVPTTALTPAACPVFLGAQSAAILHAENAKPHRFSGIPKDFRSFERDLEVYFERWTSVQAGALTDRMKMDILEEVLDQATSKMLHEWRSTDPAMDFMTVWKKVRRMFGDAVVGGARQEWRALRFEYSGKPSTSVVSWRNFCADFQRLRKEVHDASEGEAIEFYS